MCRFLVIGLFLWAIHSQAKPARFNVTVPGIAIVHFFPQHPDPKWRNTVDKDDCSGMITISNRAFSASSGNAV